MKHMVHSVKTSQRKLGTSNYKMLVYSFSNCMHNVFRMKIDAVYLFFIVVIDMFCLYIYFRLQNGLPAGIQSMFK